MKLFLNTTSPYARMVRIVILEKGFDDEVEYCWCDPWSDEEVLLKQNPVGRIPTLITNSGTAITESTLIAGYLTTLKPDVGLVTTEAVEASLHLSGLGVGLMDVSFSTVISRKYLDIEANNSVLSNRRLNAIGRTMEYLEDNVRNYSTGNSISIGDIAVAVALDYLAFRLPELKTNARYPNLEQWRTEITKRTSFESTKFE